MSGKGRQLVLGVHSPEPVLSLAAPFGLAANVSSCLVVDLGDDLRLNAARTLSDLAVEGPRLEELSPGRRGIAVIGGGSIGIGEAERIVDELALRWPAVVVRAPRGVWQGPSVPVIPMYPGLLAATDHRASVWQPVGVAGRPPGPGPVLPVLRPGLVRRLLSGQMPARSRWIAAWRQVWELPWA